MDDPNVGDLPEGEAGQMGGTVVNPVQVQKFLKGVDYPINKQNLINTARQQGADDNVIKTLEQMPGEEFNSPNDVTEAIGKLT